MPNFKSPALAALHGMAEGMHRAGALPTKTMRGLDQACLTPVQKLSPDQIRALREKTGASQAVFARYVGVTPGLISQWERGEKTPSGPALKLLALVQKKGLEAIA